MVQQSKSRSRLSYKKKRSRATRSSSLHSRATRSSNLFLSSSRPKLSRRRVSRAKSFLKRHKGKLALGAGLAGLGYLGTRPVGGSSGQKMYHLVGPALAGLQRKTRSRLRKAPVLNRFFK